jgi:hypothetical protein
MKMLSLAVVMTIVLSANNASAGVEAESSGSR